MRAFTPVIIPTAGLAFTIAMLATPSSARAETAAQPAAQVVAVRATSACFSASIRVTGFLVAREEAVVTLDVPDHRGRRVRKGGRPGDVRSGARPRQPSS